MYDFSTFARFVLSTNGQHIGNGECWDYINLLWNHLGSRYYTYPPSDPSATNHGVKWGVINSEARAANTINHLSFISQLSQVLPGDVVVISEGNYGHAGFAFESYQGNNRLKMYSQNVSGRETVALDNINVSTFVGAFRYDEWNGQPPEPPVYNWPKSTFPWVLYARKLRQRR